MLQCLAGLRRRVVPFPCQAPRFHWFWPRWQRPLLFHPHFPYQTLIGPEYLFCDFCFRLPQSAALLHSVQHGFSSFLVHQIRSVPTIRCLGCPNVATYAYDFLVLASQTSLFSEHFMHGDPVICMPHLILRRWKFWQTILLCFRVDRIFRFRPQAVMIVHIEGLDVYKLTRKFSHWFRNVVKSERSGDVGK